MAPRAKKPHLHAARKQSKRAKSPARVRHIFAETIPSDLNAVEPMLTRAMAALERCGAVDGLRVPLDLALREAVVNAIQHGNRMDPRKPVHVECNALPGNAVEMVVRDQGRGFDPEAIENPLLPENLLRSTGRGLLIIRHSVDEVTFQRGGREIHMRKSW